MKYSNALQYNLARKRVYSKPKVQVKIWVSSKPSLLGSARPFLFKEGIPLSGRPRMSNDKPTFVISVYPSMCLTSSQRIFIFSAQADTLKNLIEYKLHFPLLPLTTVFRKTVNNTWTMKKSLIVGYLWRKQMKNCIRNIFRIFNRWSWRLPRFCDVL